MKMIDTHKIIITVLILWGVVLLSTAEASRIKELAQLEGVRSNQLVGYGLVVVLTVRETVTVPSLLFSLWSA